MLSLHLDDIISPLPVSFVIGKVSHGLGRIEEVGVSLVLSASSAVFEGKATFLGIRLLNTNLICMA